MKQFIVCSRCGGTGRVCSEGLSRTLSVVSTKHPMSTQEVFEALKDPDIKITAVNNRLTALERAGGIIKRGKRGKAILWQRVVTRPLSPSKLNLRLHHG